MAHVHAYLVTYSDWRPNPLPGQAHRHQQIDVIRFDRSERTRTALAALKILLIARWPQHRRFTRRGESEQHPLTVQRTQSISEIRRIERNRQWLPREVDRQIFFGPPHAVRT